MLADKGTPTVLVFWRGQRTADATGEATCGLRSKHTTTTSSVPMVCDRHKPEGGGA